MQLTNFVLEKMQIAFLPLPALLCLFSLGVLLVAKGGDLFVESATKLAKLFKIPEATIGATLVSFATALPEILVSLFAAREGKIDMAVENAVGSVNANIGLIFALALVFFDPKAKLCRFDRKAVLLLVCASFLFFTAKDGQISKMDASLLFLLFLLCCLESIYTPKQNREKKGTLQRKKISIKTALVPFVTFWIGAFLLSVGADLLVDNGTTLARRFGISEAILAATILSVGTALPVFSSACFLLSLTRLDIIAYNFLKCKCFLKKFYFIFTIWGKDIFG